MLFPICMIMFNFDIYNDTSIWNNDTTLLGNSSESFWGWSYLLRWDTNLARVRGDNTRLRILLKLISKRGLKKSHIHLASLAMWVWFYALTLDKHQVWIVSLYIRIRFIWILNLNMVILLVNLSLINDLTSFNLSLSSRFLSLPLEFHSPRRRSKGLSKMSRFSLINFLNAIIIFYYYS